MTFAIDAAHIDRQREFSERTFGPGARLAGVLDHIRKELVEVEAEPQDLSEWADLIILALDGAWREGHGSQAILDAINAKQTKNEGRKWPDWRTADTGVAIEHVRGKVLYLSGPMAGLPEFNYPAFHEAAAKLRAVGFEVLNPAENVPDDADGNHRAWEDFMRIDVPLVCRAGGVALMPGWENSRGAALETPVAREIGIPMHTWEYWLLNESPQ